MDDTLNPPSPLAPTSDIARRVTITAELTEMESGIHVFVTVHLVCHFECTLSLDWVSPTGQGKRLLDLDPPAAHRLYLQEVVASEEILIVSVSPAPSTPDEDVEQSDACYFQVLQGSAHTHELVCSAIENEDAHTAFDISIRHLPTIHQPQDIPEVHLPWRPKHKE
ncbi:hypothetical protein [Ktedonobacter racemifer]|uniref:Uncharacterized protein n=1 Tax=Ktedonobacter racemifer DSM 44963 TaxID=485913 RepID=D6U3H3_KTERA|nr:hypothetical protein [Ktedonobacter racemifer]EFH82963.1 hypothetical protein Krac_3862 [Ktedonobacter racemifer DSM 44963]